MIQRGRDWPDPNAVTLLACDCYGEFWGPQHVVCTDCDCQHPFYADASERRPTPPCTDLRCACHPEAD